ncbi:MAG: molybdopterin cofactor-binding domain-containing protein, partial [Runella zeae]
ASNTDGSVLVAHGGVEMGQGLHTKVAQVVAECFGIPLSKVTVSESNSLCQASSTSCWTQF